jgi:hypothetical protein
MALQLSDVLADPAKAAATITHAGTVFGVAAATGRSTRYGAALLEMTLDPLPALAAEGYPVERVRIAVLRDERTFAYVLSGRTRPFKHRNPPPSRSLCLQYSADDPALQWVPDDGLEPLVTLVRRHLIFEEYNRRHRRWPCEDAPHGPAAASAHPVVTRQMRALQREWTRRAG